MFRKFNFFGKRVVNSNHLNGDSDKIVSYKSLRASLEEVADYTSDGTDESGLFIVPIPSDAIALDFNKTTKQNDSRISGLCNSSNDRTRNKTTSYGRVSNHTVNETSVNQAVITTPAGSTIVSDVSLQTFLNSSGSSFLIDFTSGSTRFDSVVEAGNNGRTRGLLDPPAPPINGRSSRNRNLMKLPRKDRMDNSSSTASISNSNTSSEPTTGGRFMGIHTMGNLVRFFGGKPKSRRTNNPTVAGGCFDSEARRNRAMEHKRRQTQSHQNHTRLNQTTNDETSTNSNVDEAMNELRTVVSSSMNEIDSLMMSLHDDPFHSSGNK